MRTLCVVALTDAWLSSKSLGDDPSASDAEHRAARVVQRIVVAKHADRNTFGRLQLLERIQLELNMFRGLRLLLLCGVIFGVVVYAANLEKRLCLVCCPTSSLSHVGHRCV